LNESDIMYAVIRIRGLVNISPKVKKTFEVLNLKRANHMSIWSETKESLRMIKQVEDYATFGKISDELLSEVIEKKGKSVEDSKEKIDIKKVLAELKAGKSMKKSGVINCFRLSPPKKGFERKGIKKPFSLGGALGNRGTNIDELIRRMM
jgi:large subunit ribosomal protein L30